METSIKGFKNWVRIKWVENCDERDLSHQTRYSFEEYVKKYKWWLRSQFRKEEEKERYRSKWRDYRNSKVSNIQSTSINLSEVNK